MTDAPPPSRAPEIGQPDVLVVGALLDASHVMSPDRLDEALLRAGAALGASKAQLYLVDYEQRTLMSANDDEPIDIESTLPGRAFMLQRTQEAHANGGRRLWVPMIDGTERLGVISFDVHDADEATVWRFEHLAALVATMLVSKHQYTDHYERLRRRRPMSLAAEMQWQLLPPLTCTTPTVAVSGVLEPAYDVGGDAFDYAIDSTVSHVAILDSVGHDVQSSVISALALGSIRHSRRQNFDLPETYDAANAALEEVFAEGRFVTGQVARLESATGQLRWINAGHPQPLIVRGGKVIGELDCRPSLPFGLGGAVAEVAEDSLEPGDRVLFYTDGVVEGRHRTGVDGFGLERLSDLLIRHVLDGLGLAETLRRLVHAVLAHHGNDLRDDATMVLLEYRGG